MKKKTVGISIIIFLIVWIILWPLAAIWAVNTLFGFTIAYTFWNWLAVVVLTAFFGKTHVKVEK
jgi:hypothetical protein